MKKKLQIGFTLIELMVVMLIIIILATMAIASYLQATQTARDGKRRTDIEAVRQALILRRQDLGSYPAGDFPTIAGSLVTNNYLSAPAPTDPQAVALNPAYRRNDPLSTTAFCICATLEGSRGNATSNACAGLGATTGGFYCAQQ